MSCRPRLPSAWVLSCVATGYGVSASYLGQPDFGLLTQTEMLMSYAALHPQWALR